MATAGFVLVKRTPAPRKPGKYGAFSGVETMLRLWLKDYGMRHREYTYTPTHPHTHARPQASSESHDTLTVCFCLRTSCADWRKANAHGVANFSTRSACTPASMPRKPSTTVPDKTNEERSQIWCGCVIPRRSCREQV